MRPIFERLIAAKGAALSKRKRPERWKFSEECWCLIRDDPNILHHVETSPPGRITHVIGLPFVIDHTLAPHTEFELVASPPNPSNITT